MKKLLKGGRVVDPRSGIDGTRAPRLLTPDHRYRGPGTVPPAPPAPACPAPAWPAW